MKPIQWLVVLGIVAGIGMLGASQAAALDWGGTWARKPNTQPNAAPTQQELQQKMQENVVTNTNIPAIATTDFLKSCTSEPSCSNSYIKSDQPCPNKLPGELSPTSYPVKGCYTCTTPSKAANVPPQQLCQAQGYSVTEWGLGTFTCYLSISTGEAYGKAPTNFLQLCPTGMASEDITSDSYHDFAGNWFKIYQYKCRFALPNQHVCNQCGAYAIPNGPNGDVYCVLPSNLPPADPNKPCGK